MKYDFHYFQALVDEMNLYLQELTENIEEMETEDTFALAKYLCEMVEANMELIKRLQSHAKERCEVHTGDPMLVVRDLVSGATLKVKSITVEPI